MSSQNLHLLLTSDIRFSRPNSKLQGTAQHISDIISKSNPFKQYNSHDDLLRFEKYLNLLRYADLNQDSFADQRPTYDDLVKIITTDIEFPGYEDIGSLQLKQQLDDYVYIKEIDLENIEADRTTANSSSSKSKQAIFLETIVSRNDETSEASKSPTEIADDSEYWAKSVSLDFPNIPQPDATDVFQSEVVGKNTYCIYKESIQPWNQSQITALTDVNAFSDKDVLALFPPIRLYTRSPYMYSEYEKLEYDEDLGVILKISGYTKKQIRKNIIEYPHLQFLDRSVKIKGKDTTIPFWKHVEIDGEIYPTIQVWDSMKDTKFLPQTESFMNEYVVRKYLLERDVKHIEHEFPMRGELYPFLTLYNTPQYYESLGYDPIETGRKCIESRIKFKQSRNPILSMFSELDA